MLNQLLRKLLRNALQTGLFEQLKDREKKIEN